MTVSGGLVPSASGGLAAAEAVLVVLVRERAAPPLLHRSYHARLRASYGTLPHHRE